MMGMQPLLFLAHRLPFPPNKGDKLRSYHFLKHLASRYRVYLGTFIDDADDWKHVAKVRSMCADLHVQSLAHWARTASSTTAFLSGEALTLPYFRSRALLDWVQRTVEREGIRQSFVFCSSMAQYVLKLPHVDTVVDFVDMDSAKWGQYAERRAWPASAVYRREAERLLQFETTVADHARATLFVTDEEARRFAAAAPQSARRVVTIRNGVDADHFSPAHRFDNPFAPNEQAIVFTGAMDYWPNVDAVVWFAKEVLPLIRIRMPAARFYAVGMNPDETVRELASDAAVSVTGRVPDVRPYLAHAAAVVAPLRVARGIQNKVLEAMAMAKAVVATEACAAPIGARAGEELEVASDAQSFARAVESIMQSPRAVEMGALARRRVVADYTWAASFHALDKLLEPALPERRLAG